MKSILLKLTLLFVPVFAMAQYEVTEQVRPMSEGYHNSLVLEIPGAEEKMVFKWWKDYIKDFDSKPQKVKKADEYLSDNADIPGIGAGNTVDVYTLIEEDDEVVRVINWFNLGGTYLKSTEHGDRYQEGYRFVSHFGLYVAKEMVKIELENEEKNLKDLEKAMDQLLRENERLHQVIADAERTIEEAKASIKINEEEQATKAEEMQNQQKVVEEVAKKLEDF